MAVTRCGGPVVGGDESRAGVSSSEPVCELAIVIPTYNERENVACLVASLEEALTGIDWRVIFVDDNSPDRTGDVLRGLSAKNAKISILERLDRRGLASACIEGMLATSAPYIAVMDADLQHDERILPEMLRRLKSEHDVDLVVASRTISGGSMGKFPPVRVWISNMGRMLSRLVCRCGVSDAMSGFFVVRRDFFQGVVYRLTGRGFKLLVDLLSSSVFPVRLIEVPYHFRSRERGESKLGAAVELQFLYMLAAIVIRKNIWRCSAATLAELAAPKRRRHETELIPSRETERARRQSQ